MTEKSIIPFVELQLMCAEILGWYETGLLSGNVLREYATKICGEGQESLRIAENAVAREAMRVIADQESRVFELHEENEKLRSTIDLLMSPPNIQVSGEQHEENTAVPVVREYYYRVDSCQASSSDDPDCICWHKEGTGPLAWGNPRRTSLRTSISPYAIHIKETP